MTSKTELNKKIYISGQITGIEDAAYEIFKNAEIALSEQGYEPINPFELNHNHDKSWEAYMRVDIKALCDCDYIYMLKNHVHSRGALIELYLAKTLGLTVIYEP